MLKGIPRSILIDGQRCWTNHRKRQYASNVEEITFVSWWAELCSSVDDAYQFDRAETVWKVDREDRNRKQSDGRNTRQRNESAN